MRTPSYSHAQTFRSLWIVIWPPVAVGGAVAVAAARPAQVPWLVALFVAIPVLTILLLGRLRIELDARHLEWQFGYLGVPRWRLELSEIVGVECIRTSWAHGWGIHRGKDGWLYNAEGFGAVRLELRDGRAVRLGSDEPERLAAFIQDRLARRH